MKIFSEKIEEKEKHGFTDLAVLVSLIVIIAAGVMFYGAQTNADSFSGYLTVNYTGVLFGAPALVFYLGMKLSQSEKNKCLLCSGGRIYVKAWLLNILRGTLPCIIIWIITRRKMFLSSALINIFKVELFHFAALSLVLVYVLKKLKLNNVAIFAVALILSLAGSFLRLADIKNVPLAFLLSHFIGTDNPETAKSFVLINWFIFAASGALFGDILKRRKNKKLFMLSVFFVSSVFVIIYTLVRVPEGLGMFAELKFFFQMNLLDALCCICGALMLLSGCFFVFKILPGFIKSFAEKCGKHAAALYFAQSTLTMWFAKILLADILCVSLPGLVSALLVAVIFALSYFALGALSLLDRKTEKIIEKIIDRKDN